MARVFALVVACSVISLLTGCASIISGSTQSIAVMPLQGGQIDPTTTCTATNRKGSWVTPGGGSVVVKKARDDLQIRCVDSESQQVGIHGAPRTTQVAFVVANFIIWDLCTISCLIDFNSGAIYEYPSQVQVVMPVAPSPAAPVREAPPPAAEQAVAPEAIPATEAQVVF